MGSNSTKQNINVGNDQILSQIEKLADLKDRGIITEAEFSDKKSNITEQNTINASICNLGINDNTLELWIPRSLSTI